MIGLGTIINTAAIVAGGVLGILFKRLINERMGDSLIKANGITVMFIGIAGAVEGMMKVENGTLKSSGSMMIIISVILGTLLGEIIDIEKRIERFGSWLKVKSKSESDAGFMDAFLISSFTVCIGAMAVIGSINDGISGDYSLLAAKAVLDFIIIMVMAASMGKGCIFSAIPVAIFQGVITLLARFIKPVMTPEATLNLSLTGSILIFCVG
ncbi:MAG: DUF554 domain-containing protein, partial [Clostridiales bacterium]|nr:DUF554 domain-containing protein [Clostridiales bacterium]